MNFARTNLSLLLARQARRSPVTRPNGHARLPAPPATVATSASAPTATGDAIAPAGEGLAELAGAIVTIAAFLVLALFG